MPTAVNTGVNSPPAPSACRFFGSYQPFDEQTLDALYRNHGSYVSRVTEATEANVLHRFLVLEDAIVTLKEASHSGVGKSALTRRIQERLASVGEKQPAVVQ